eukprot:3750302-Rhodomonas_salina.2
MRHTCRARVLWGRCGGKGGMQEVILSPCQPCESTCRHPRHNHTVQTHSPLVVPMPSSLSVRLYEGTDSGGSREGSKAGWVSEDWRLAGGEWSAQTQSNAATPAGLHSASAECSSPLEKTYCGELSARFYRGPPFLAHFPGHQGEQGRGHHGGERIATASDWDCPWPSCRLLLRDRRKINLTAVTLGLVKSG